MPENKCLSTFSPRLHRTIKVLSIALLLVFIGSLPVMAMPHGDINRDGRLDVQDVALVMRASLGLTKLNDLQFFLADVNDDRVVNVLDVSLIMQKTLGLIETFAGAPSARNDLIEQFMVEAGLAPGSKLVIVTLKTENPQNHLVFVGNIQLFYSERVNGFLAEVPEKEASKDNAAVFSR